MFHTKRHNDVLADQFSGAGQPRHDRAHRNVQHIGNFLVFHLFNISQKQHLPKIGRQLLYGLPHQFSVCAANQDRLRIIRAAGRVFKIFIFLGSIAALQGGAAGQIGVAQNALLPWWSRWN